MTPALKAMVEAMAAEFQRQDAERRTVPTGAGVVISDGDFGVAGRLYDLEKVARAGMEAIKGVQAPNLKAVYEAADDHGCYVSAEALAAMIDAILKASLD